MVGSGARLEEVHVKIREISPRPMKPPSIQVADESSSSGVTSVKKKPIGKPPSLVQVRELASRSFSEIRRETDALLFDVEAKVTLLRRRVDDLKSLGDSSRTILSDTDTGAGDQFLMSRSRTFGDLNSQLGGALDSTEVSDVEYEQIASFGERPTVKSASTERLILFAATNEVNGENLRRSVILSFRMYMSPVDLLGRLMLLYTRTPEYQSEKLYLKMYSLLEPLRTGVLETFLLWAQIHPRDFVADNVKRLLERFSRLLKHTKSADDKTISEIEKLMHVGDAPVFPIAISSTVFNEGSLMSLANMPSEEIAKQLTLIEFSMYQRMQAVEFHRIAKGFDNAPTMELICKFFDRGAQFFVSQVLKDKSYDPVVVASYIAGLVAIGHACKSWRNWDGLMMVVAALNTTAVSRLSDAWAQLSRQDAQNAEELTAYAARNFRALRDGMKASSSPSIPHFALAVRDLTGLEEIPTLIVTNGHVNVHKIQTVGRVMWETIRFCDGTPYAFKHVTRLQDWIQFSPILSESEAYQRSRLYTAKESAPPMSSVQKRLNRRSMSTLVSSTPNETK